eukprot:gb/GECG01012465.1/.p1 GENE.gb/GECG01012465.1/~~gb/GECG01012465.1/.p1  ORF type:complete len:790 (+),score=157.09 gb/GECG01012465.1/:1-2370(+)
MKLFEGTMLGGGVLRLQWANVDYLTKLEREWQQSSLSQNKGNLSNQESQHDHSTGGNLSAASPAIPKNFRIRRRKGESMFKVPSAPVELGKYPLSSTASSVQEAGSRRKRAGVPERMMFEDDTANVLGNVQRNIRGELDTNDEIPGESAWSKSTESVMKQYDKKQISEAQRKTAQQRRAEEQRLKKQRIQESLRGTSQNTFGKHVAFTDEGDALKYFDDESNSNACQGDKGADGDGTNAGSNSHSIVRDEKSIPAQLFDDDDENSDNGVDTLKNVLLEKDHNVNEASTEDVDNATRRELQRMRWKYGVTDPRFRIDERFVETDASRPAESHDEVSEDEQIKETEDARNCEQMEDEAGHGVKMNVSELYERDGHSKSLEREGEKGLQILSELLNEKVESSASISDAKTQKNDEQLELQKKNPRSNAQTAAVSEANRIVERESNERAREAISRAKSGLTGDISLTGSKAVVARLLANSTTDPIEETEQRSGNLWSKQGQSKPDPVRFDPSSASAKALISTNDEDYGSEDGMDNENFETEGSGATYRASSVATHTSHRSSALGNGDGSRFWNVNVRWSEYKDQRAAEESSRMPDSRASTDPSFAFGFNLGHEENGSWLKDDPSATGVLTRNSWANEGGDSNFSFGFNMGLQEKVRESNDEAGHKARRIDQGPSFGGGDFEDQNDTPQGMFDSFKEKKIDEKSLANVPTSLSRTVERATGSIGLLASGFSFTRHTPRGRTRTAKDANEEGDSAWVARRRQLTKDFKRKLRQSKRMSMGSTADFVGKAGYSTKM